MNNTNTTRIEEKNMKCHRKLTPEEINELNTLLESTIKNNNKTTSSQEDINDLLEYLLAMVSNGKSITYIKSELLNMDMDTVCDIATVGACIRAFMETLVDNCDTTGASMQQQDIEEEEDDNTSTVDSTNVSGPRMKLLKSKIATNALTQSGALGASRIKSIEDKKTTAKPKKTPPAKKNKSTLASSAFQRLATTKKGGSQQQQQQRRQENGRGGKQQKQRMQNRNNKRLVEEDFIAAAASPTPNHQHRNHGQRGGGRPGRGDERGDRSGRGDERGRGGGPVRGRDNGGRMGGRGGRDNGGRMSGRGEVRGGGHGRGRSVVINSTTSHHHQSYNKRMKFDNDANIPNSSPQYPQQPTFNTNKSYHRGNKPQPPNQTHAQEAKTMPPSLIATTSPSPLIAASFGTTPILRGGPGRDGGPGRGGGRGRGRHHIPGRTDVKELLASKTWVRKRGMEEELGTKR